MNIRTKLLLSYLFFIFLGSINIQIALWLYEGYTDANNFAQYFNEIRVKTQQDIAESQHFLLYETLNPHFFSNKQSDILTQKRQTVASIHQNLILLKNNNLFKEQNFSAKTDSLMLFLERYEIIFNELVDNIYARGFKDSGLEGKMREFAHQLEQSKQVNLSQVLTLRRWEKDYLIRHDSLSIKRFEQEMNRLLSQFRGNAVITHLLNSYYNSFQQMILLEQKIGKNTDTGLTYALRNQSAKFEKYLMVTLAQINQIREKKVSDLQNTFWLIVLIMLIISILTSVIIAQRFTKPILGISEMLENIVQSNFDKNVPIVHIKGQDEVSQMSGYLNVMIDKMQESFTFLNQKNREIGDKNLALIEFNQQISESERQLKKMNQIKDKFFSIIAHDLRGPFNSLRGFIYILMNYSEGLSKEEIKDLTLQLNESIKNIANLTNNLLEWALAQTEGVKIELRDLNLYDAVDDTVQLLNYEANRKRITIHNQVNKNVNVKADQNILYFVVRNLITNAIKFTNESGEIKVEGYEINGQVYTQIIDNGIGMPQELVDNLFKLDEKVSRDGTSKEKGTGLGLLLCKEFLERSGGKITVSSEIGKGSIFTFAFPTAEGVVLEASNTKSY